MLPRRLKHFERHDERVAATLDAVSLGVLDAVVGALRDGERVGQRLPPRVADPAAEVDRRAAAVPRADLENAPHVRLHGDRLQRGAERGAVANLAGALDGLVRPEHVARALVRVVARDVERRSADASQAAAAPPAAAQPLALLPRPVDHIEPAAVRQRRRGRRRVQARRVRRRRSDCGDCAEHVVGRLEAHHVSSPRRGALT
eukprot:1456091-Prymnesium_polylepis.1